MTDENTISAAHEFARGYADWLRTHRAAKFDRKMLRFNDVVAVGLHYDRCGTSSDLAVIGAGIEEAIQSCDKTNAEMHIPGRGPLTMIQTWMECR